MICEKQECFKCYQNKQSSKKSKHSSSKRHHKHQKCNLINAQQFINSIKNKKGSNIKSFQSTTNKILQIYDKTIEFLSEQRQHIQNSITNYGLTLSQITFINKVNENTLKQQFSKNQFIQVVSHSKNIRQLNVNMIYDHLFKIWQEKQDQFLSFFKFRQDQFFTTINKNQVTIEQYDQEMFNQQIFNLKKQNLKGLKVINLNNFMSSEFIQHLSQFKNLQRLNIYSTYINFKLNELFKVISISMPKLQQIKIISHFEVQQNVFKDILQLENIKKVSVISDIQIPFNKKYQIYFFFNDNIQKSNNNFTINVKPNILQKQEYWDSCKQISQQKQIHLKNLKHYNIQKIQKNQEGILQKVLLNNNKLLSLRINESNIIFKNQTYWKYLSSLKKLILQNCKSFTSQDLAHICHNCTNIQHLALDHIIPTTFIYKPLEKLKKLKSLSLSNKQLQKQLKKQQYISEDLVKQIQIKEQNFFQIIDEEARNNNQWLGKLCNLKTLNIVNNQHYDIHWLANIKKLTKLQFLALNAPLTYIQSIVWLQNLTMLRTLILEDEIPNPLLFKILDKMKKLTKLKCGTIIHINQLTSKIKNIQNLSLKGYIHHTINFKQFYLLFKLKYLNISNVYIEENIFNQFSLMGVKLNAKKKKMVQVKSEPKYQSEDSYQDFGGLFD